MVALGQTGPAPLSSCNQHNSDILTSHTLSALVNGAIAHLSQRQTERDPLHSIGLKTFKAAQLSSHSYLVIRKITWETFQSLPHLTVQDTPSPPFPRCISVPTPSLNHTEMNTLTEELFPSYQFLFF